jgi:hypothetical protein
MQMDKDEGLILPSLVKDLLVANLIRNLVLFDGFLLCYPDKLLLLTARPVYHIKIKPALGWINTEEGHDILVVGQCHRETHKMHILRCLFHVPYRMSNDTLQHWVPFIMQKVNLINNDEVDKISVAGVGTLAGDNVPLLWGHNDDLGL